MEPLDYLYKLENKSFGSFLKLRNSKNLVPTSFQDELRKIWILLESIL